MISIDSTSSLQRSNDRAQRSLEIDGVPAPKGTESARDAGKILGTHIDVMPADVPRLAPVKVAIRTIGIVRIRARITARTTSLILFGPH